MSEKPQVYIPPEAKGMTIEEEEELQGLLKGVPKSGKWDHFTPEFVGTKAQEIKPEELIQQLNAARDIFLSGRLTQPEGEVVIQAVAPIAVAFLGDLHLGSIYTNTDEVMRKVETIEKTPGMYTVFMSNLIDNAIPSQFPNNMLANGITPDKQVALIRNICVRLNEKGKVLGAVTSPCHEGWTYKHTGQDINALIFGFPERHFPVLENGGRLHLKVGSQEYMGALYHQVGPFESNFNETHALRQLNRLQQGMECDFLAGAHRHIAAAQVVYENNGEHRKTVAYIRTGTEKGTSLPHDQFSVDRYGATGEPTGQTIHFWPDERRLDATCDFDTAVAAHMAYYLMALAESQRTKVSRRRK